MPPKCPRGQRRSRRTGLCESCPPGTARTRNGRCDPIPVPPAPPLLARLYHAVVPPPPVPVDPQPYRYQSLPPRGRCPPQYHRDPNPPHNCHSCLGDDAVLSHTSGLCHPIVQVPANADGSCPRGTRKRRGACIRTVGDVNAISALHSPRPAAVHMPAPAPAAHAAPAAPAPYPVPRGLPPGITRRLVGEIRLLPGEAGNSIYRGIRVINALLVYCFVQSVAIRRASVDYLVPIFNRFYEERTNNPLDIVNFEPPLHMWCRYLNRMYTGLDSPSQVKMDNVYFQFIHMVLAGSLSLDVGTADRTIQSILHTLPMVLNDKIHYQEDPRELAIHNIHEIIRDYGTYVKMDGKFFLIPVAFKQTVLVHVPRTPFVPPAQMTDLEMYDEIPFQADRPGYVCVVIEERDRVQAFSVPIESIRRGSNPRTPMWMYMKCKGPSTSYAVNDAMVHSDKMYLDLTKIGIPQHAYVDINQIYTALTGGHTCVILRPSVVTQLASAYLYNVIQSAVGSTHCEAGQTGNFYDLYLPN